MKTDETTDYDAGHPPQQCAECGLWYREELLQQHDGRLLCDFCVDDRKAMDRLKAFNQSFMRWAERGATIIRRERG